MERPFSLEHADGVLTVQGTVDEFSIVRLRNEIEELGAARDLVIELSGVDVLPSVGIGVLARAMEQARRAGRRIDLVAGPDTIAQRILLVCGLPYEHTLGEARDASGDRDEPTA